MLQHSLGLLEGPGWPTISSGEGGLVVRSQHHWSRVQHFFSEAAQNQRQNAAPRSSDLGNVSFSIGSLPLGSEGEVLKCFPSRPWQEMRREERGSWEVAAVLMSHQPAGFRPILHVQTTWASEFMPPTAGGVSRWLQEQGVDSIMAWILISSPWLLFSTCLDIFRCVDLRLVCGRCRVGVCGDRKSTRLNSSHWE